ncbi:uncharacterized protein lrrc74b [Aplochiton taeniatus]
MVHGKKLAKEFLLPCVLEVEDDASSQCEQLGEAGSRPQSGTRETHRQGRVGNSQTLKQSGFTLSGPSGKSSSPEGEVLDKVERGEDEEMEKENVEDGDEEKSEEECVPPDDGDYDTDLELGGMAEVYDTTGQTRYLEACKVLKVVPASCFLRHMQNAEFSMMHRGLGPQGTKALAVPLVTNTSILRLNLRDNWMEGMGGAAMAEMLKENCYITEVDLSENHLGEQGAKAMGSMLQENCTLVSLSLARNQFNDRAAQHLAQALTVNTKLQCLELSHNAMGEEAGEILGDMLAENTGLRSLSLAWNCIRGKGAVALAKGLGANIFVRTLDLSYNGMGREGAIALGQALKDNNTIEGLNISNNRIPPEGAIRFSMGLKVNKTIKSLNVGRNPIQTAGCYGILKSMQENPESAMEALDFSDITVNQDFEDLYNAVKDMFPDLKIKHGGRIDTFSMKGKKMVGQSTV